MGFRGSRVQIPPSRFVKRSTAIDSLIAVLSTSSKRSSCGRVSVAELGDAPTVQLPRFSGDGSDRLVIGLLIDVDQSVMVSPAPGGSDILHGQVLALRRPLSPVRMP